MPETDRLLARMLAEADADYAAAHLPDDGVSVDPATMSLTEPAPHRWGERRRFSTWRQNPLRHNAARIPPALAAAAAAVASPP